jgi:UPF0716 protein FxsA
MLIALIFIFLALPALEIYLFVVVGGLIGPLPTIGLTFLAALVGMMVIRAQAPRTIGRVQESLRRGEAPMGDVLDGLALFVAGVLLIVPGFFTDVIGLLLLVPWVRRTLGHALLARVVVMRGQPGKSAAGDVIDGEFEVVPGSRDRGPVAPQRRIPPTPEAG